MVRDCKIDGRERNRFYLIRILLQLGGEAQLGRDFQDTTRRKQKAGGRVYSNQELGLTFQSKSQRDFRGNWSASGRRGKSVNEELNENGENPWFFLGGENESNSTGVR